MASRSLADLRPDVKDMAILHVAECAKAGIDLLIYCTYRSSAEQDTLYAIGRTTKGAIVTNARGGQSNHNKTDKAGKPSSLAYDAVPLIGGKPQWANKELYVRAGEIGEAVGLAWAGRWTGKMRETAHWEAK